MSIAPIYTSRGLTSFLLLLSTLATLTSVVAWPSQSFQSVPNEKRPYQHFQPSIGRWPSITKRNASTAMDFSTGLPAHHWQLAGKTAHIERFRHQHNLTRVDSKAQEAALMPSWPQAFVQYVFIAPPFGISSRNYEIINGVIRNSSRGVSFWILVVAAPILSVAWTVSFGLTQASKATAGWMSVLGWSAWLSLCLEGFWSIATLPLLFQLTASLTIIIQRWCGSIGTIAYDIVDLHGCVPSEGLSYLERGARAEQYKIFQTVAFSLTVVAGVSRLGDCDRKRFNEILAVIALAELIMDAVVANLGTPMVVSGNCLLVELNPRLGFLDSGISTPWKALSSFMGF